MFRHGEHLLQVGLHLAAVLVVDGVSVARHWGALVAPDVGVGNIEPGVGQSRAFRRGRGVLTESPGSLSTFCSKGRAVT